MAIYKKHSTSHNTQLFVWHITESEEALRKGIVLTKLCFNRLDMMKSPIHRRGFLSVRQLLAVVGYTPKDLFYDVFGKPHLKDGKFISISHSHTYAAIAVGDKPLGVDIELEQPKVQRIAPRFLHPSEITPTATDRVLTTQWCLKEAAYKALGKKGLSFLHHMRTANMDDIHPKTIVQQQGKQIALKNWVYHWENFSCALAIITD